MMSNRKPSQPVLVATAAVQFRDAVVGNAIGLWRSAITAEAICPVVCFYPPLHLGAYFFKRALSFHGALACPILCWPRAVLNN